MRVHDCNLMRYAKTRITMLITALHSGQLPPSSATRRAQFSQNLACPQGTKAKPSIGANRHTSQHRNGVSAAAGAPGTDAADDALAAVGVNCSASSSSAMALVGEKCGTSSLTFANTPVYSAWVLRDISAYTTGKAASANDANKVNS